MSKLLSTLIAAVFAVTTFGAVAQTPPAKGDAPKADTQKADKKAKSNKPKAEKKAKSDKPKADTKAKGDGTKAKGDSKKAKGNGKQTKGNGKKSEKAAAPKKEETKK